MNKRGQIAVFIIIGVIILFAIGAVFLIRSYVVEREVAFEVGEAEELPEEMEPIRTFTQNCIETVGSRALVRLGQQGGYIYPVEWDRMSFDITEPTNSDGISFPNSELRVPYWWHNAAENEQNQIFLSSNQPSLEKMEDDLARYVSLELGSCLNNYESFRPLGFEVVEGRTTAEVGIVPGEVRFLVEHPLEITLGEGEARARNFYVTVPLDLMQVYGVANDIMVAQRNFSFLETHALNLMELFSGIDKNKLPPTTDLDFEIVSSIFWSKTKVKQDIKQILSAYIPMIRHLDSRNFYRYQFRNEAYDEVKQRVYDNMILTLDGAEDLDVRFYYLDWWEPYLDINAHGELIKPEHFSTSFFGLGVFGIQRYNTVYDLSFPVFISLNLPQSLDGQDYQFNFALESNIRNNRAAENGQTRMQPFSLYQETLLCSENQKNSPVIQVKVVDQYTGEALDESEIIFSVGEEKCSIGVTNDKGVLESRFPIAIGGVLTAIKEGYVTSSSVFDTDPDFYNFQNTFEMRLWPFKNIGVEIQKKKLFNCKKKPDDEIVCFQNADEPAVAENPFEAVLQEELITELPILADVSRVKDSQKAKRTLWYFDGQPYDLDDDEQAMLVLERISGSDSEVSRALTLEAGTTGEVRLVPGKYKVTIQIFSERQFAIPEEERCPGWPAEAIGGCSDLAGIEFNKMVLGGTIWHSNETYWNLEPSELYSGNRLIFFASSPSFHDIPLDQRIVEDMEIVGKQNEISKTFRRYLEPLIT